MANQTNHNPASVTRRSAVIRAFATLGLGAFDAAAQQPGGNNAPISPKDSLKITRLEMFLVKPRWLFLKVHTNAGITGLGEPITEGRALTCKQAVEEVAPYLIGKTLTVHGKAPEPPVAFLNARKQLCMRVATWCWHAMTGWRPTNCSQACAGLYRR